MIKIRNQYLKNALFAIEFYILLLIMIFFTDYFSASGSSCMSGFGTAILIFFGIPLISGVMFMINSIKYFIEKEKELKFSLAIHLVIFISFLAFILYHKLI